jgi:hypothetical protein
LAAGTLEDLDGFAVKMEGLAGAFAPSLAACSDPASRADRPARSSPRLLYLICPERSLRQGTIRDSQTNVRYSGRGSTYSPRSTKSESESIGPASTEDKKAASAKERVK